MAQLQFDVPEEAGIVFTDAIAREILEAGAEVYKEEWKNSIKSHYHVRTGSMVNAVAATDLKRTADGYTISIYPTGSDSHGVSNATKAYVINYGRGGKRTPKTGDKFVSIAEQAAVDKANAAMSAKLNEILAR